MMSFRSAIVGALIACGLAGCSGGSSNLPVCSFDDPAVIAPSAWPKFRHDRQNSGSVQNPLVAMNAGQLRWVFPPPSQNPKGAFVASPVLNGVASDPTSASRVYIGSADGILYALDSDTGEQDTTFIVPTAQPITSTALVALRDGRDAIFVGGGDGLLYGVDANGGAQATNWPFTSGAGFLSASVTLGKSDGTLYTGSVGDLFIAVCPNGIGRFSLVISGVQSSPAVSLDGNTLYFGADDRQLRAVRIDGLVEWTFAASGPILAAPVVDPDGSIYAVDRRGRVFKVSSSGAPVAGFDFIAANGTPVGPIASSPALAGGKLYFGSDDGNLYAVDTQSGMIEWSFTTGGPILSSPAVASGAAQPIVVVGSDDGNVYFVQDNGPVAPPEALLTFTIGAAVRSSPAIGSDGTVYVGAGDGRVYAIGAGLTPGATPTATPAATAAATPTQTGAAS